MATSSATRTKEWLREEGKDAGPSLVDFDRLLEKIEAGLEGGSARHARCALLTNLSAQSCGELVEDFILLFFFT